MRKPDKSSLYGSEESLNYTDTLKPDEWVRCFCVYSQEQEKIGCHSCERAIFRGSVLRFRVQMRVSIMWPLMKVQPHLRFKGCQVLHSRLGAVSA